MNSQHLAAYIKDHARRNPAGIAIKSYDTVLSYKELDNESNRIANFFDKNLFRDAPAVGENHNVCVILDRSAEIIISGIGLLKAGLVFVPVSPHIPEKRVELLLEQTETRWVVTSPEYYEKFRELFLRKNGPNVLTAEDFKDQSDELQFEMRYNKYCYIYFTSGSTGIPKGVLGRHKSLHHFIDWEITEFGIDHTFNVSQFTQPAFDPYLRDIFVPLLAGGTICIPDYDTLMNPAKVIKWINDNKIRLIHIVPSLFKLISDEIDGPGNFWDLDYILLAGELLRGNDVRKFIEIFDDRIRLFNIYGPTETTLAKFFYPIQSVDAGKSIIPVGKTIKGAEALILDEQRQKCLTGNIGEIYIRTPYISSGYYNNKELNKDVFVKNPFSNVKNDLIYKTGDLGRFLFDGNVELVGRLDGQVKIRGNRVETGEIENLLLSVNQIKEAVVVDEEDQNGEKYLCAFLVPANGGDRKGGPDIGGITIQTLKQMLAKHIPAYMLPSYFITLDAMPLTPNGKIDRKSLHKPESAGVRETAYAAPQNDVEKTVIEIWSDILSLPQGSIGIDDNFFELGGHSLKAIGMASKIHKQLNVQVPLVEVFNRSTTRRLAEYIYGKAGGNYESINPVEEKEYYTLSSAQKRLYFLQQLEPDNTAYNIPLFIPLPGDVGGAKLEDTFRRLIKRHDSLRTSFYMVDNAPVQKIFEDVEFETENIGLSGPETDAACGTIDESIVNSFIRPFDLSRAPLMRVGLLKTKNGEMYLLVDVHHIITDGVSQIVLSRDFMSLYEGNVLPPLRIQYKDFSEWRHRNKKTGEPEQQERFWLREFEGEIPVLEIPTDFPRPAIRSLEGSSIYFELNREITRSILEYTREKTVTLYMLLLAVTNTLLSKLSGRDDIVIGTTVAGRDHADLEKVIGMFVNTLALRNYPDGDKKFSEFLGEVKKKTLEVFEYQGYPFEDLVGKVKVDRNMARNPLFDVMLVLQNMDTFQGNGFENSVPPPPGYGVFNGISKFDLTITVWEVDQGLKFSFQYCTKLFKEETIRRFRDYFCRIVLNVLEKPETKICEISVITGEEKKRLLYEFNDSAARYPKDVTIHRLFENRVEKNPHGIALIGPPSSFVRITYGELNKNSNRIASMLRAKGVTRDTIAGIMVERSLEMVTGLLGILKAGGAYLPIDPDYPRERVDFILKDSGAAIFLTEDRLSDCLRNGPACSVEPVEPAAVHPRSANSLAYIIYTSGTTGSPKGVLVEHRNVVRLMINDKFQFDFGTRDVWTMFHSFNFDFSVWEMYGALLYGGKLIIVPKMVSRDPGEFLEILKREQVTVLNQTPSAFYNLIEEEIKSGEKELGIRYVIFGGEALKPVKLKPWREKYPGTKLVNMFGITETTVHVTYKEIGDNEIDFNIGNIGIPIPTTTTYVADRYLNLLPPGAVGELLVGGDGVGRGYLNRPGLTAERFIPNLFKANERIYRSGDLTRLFHDGEMKYLGRMDHQVQLKGFRIELGEIENRLLQFDGINEVVVTAAENAYGDYTHLCAYFVSRGDIGLNALRKYLALKLPEYMIPRYFIPLESIPLTSNGKINHAALKEKTVSAGGGDGYTAPVDQIQEKLVEIWQQVLQVEPIGIKDNYFNLGGDSINAIALVSAINTVFHSNLKIVDLYMNQTVESLSLRVKEREGRPEEELADLLAEIDALKTRVIQNAEDAGNIEDVFPMSDIEKGMVFHYLKDSEMSVYNNQALYQVVYEDFDIVRMKKAFGLLMEKHPILRTAYIGDEFAHVVYKNVPVDIQYHDISSMDIPGMKALVIRCMTESRNKPYDVEVAPLWRMSFFNTGIQNIVIVLWEVHHAIVDGWSNATLLPEMDNTYLGLKENPGMVLPKLKSGYKEYILQQMVDRRNPETANYWKKELSDYKRLVFPGEVETGLGKNKKKTELKTIRISLEADKRQKLESTAKIYDTSLKHLSFTAYALMLSMLSYENDIVMGLVTNNRPVSEDGDKIIGCFLNTVPVRIKIPDRIGSADLIKAVDKKLLELKKYDRLSLFEILMHLGEKSGNRNPLMDTLFNFTDFYAYRQSKTLENMGEVPDILDVKNYEESNFSFTLSINTLLGGFLATFVYSTALLSDDDFKKVSNYFLRILELFVNHPEAVIDKGKIMSPGEKKELLDEFNDTEAPFPGDKTVHEMFAMQVEKTPDHVALVFKDGQFTYKELNDKAHRAAGLLREKGIGPNHIVGIMLRRSHHITLGILATLKAGGAYLPIGPENPVKRVRFLLKDSAATVLVTERETVDGIDFDGDIISPDRVESGNFPGDGGSPMETGNRLSDIAYIIYTSGTTGNPKGVVVEHGNLLCYLNAFLREFNTVGRKDIVVQQVTYSFDAFVEEIYPPLVKGAKIVVPTDDETINIDLLVEFLIRREVTLISGSPLLLNEINKREKLKTGCLFISGGDTLRKEYITNLLKAGRIYNTYGPTEATVCAAYYDCGNSREDEGSSIPIGRPISNYRIYIVDRNLNVLPTRVPGELCISGKAVTRGYLNRPGLTREKFVKDPFSKNAVIYKSGDLARRLPDGNIEFLGRIDHQIKIRGFRIELGEIENRLSNHPEIGEAVVLAHEDSGGDRYICAYIVSGIELDVSRLMEYLAVDLPDYMIPSYFVPLEKIPLTPGGKPDRNALPMPVVQAGKTHVPPGNEIETKLVELWAEVLNIQGDIISIDRNFFELGGHSLRATVLASRIHKELNVRVPLAEFFRKPTVRDLSRYIEGKSKEFYISIEPAEEKEYYVLSPAQKRLYVLHRLVTDSTGYNMPSVIPLDEEVEKDKLDAVFNALIARHDGFRTSFISVDDEPVQRISRESDFSIECYHVETESEAFRLIPGFTKPFDLSKAPLLRANLVTIGSSRRLLAVDMHHIITDGTSHDLLEKDFRALLAGEELAPLRLQYKDYTQWYNCVSRQEAIRKQGVYWLNEFCDEIPVLNLPTDYPRPLVQNFEGNVVHFILYSEESGGLRAAAENNDVTVYMYVLAILNVLSAKLSGQEDIIIGTPVAARRHADLLNVIGMLVNTLAMRNYPLGDKTFTGFLREVKERTLAAYENQDYPFEMLVDHLKVNRDTGRNPVFDVMFNLLNQSEYRGDAPPIDNTSYTHTKGTSKFDLNVTAIELGDITRISFEYSTNLFKPGTIERLIGYFKNIVHTLTRDPGINISEVQIMGEAEKEEVLRLSRGVEFPYEGAETIHGWFEEQVEKTPDNIAVTGQSVQVKSVRLPVVQLSYRELNDMADGLAYRLREKGVVPGSAVGLTVERSVEMIIGILGIIKAGAAYLPIDSEYPAERKKYMLEDADVRWLLVSDTSEYITRLEEVIDTGQGEIYRKRNGGPGYIGRGPDPLYVIYTSGSTGKPKGVMLEHRNLVNLMHYQYENTHIDFNRVLQFATISFDVSAQEIFSVLLSGGRLFLVNKETRTDIPLLFGLIERNRIKTVFLPVSFLKAIFKEEDYIDIIPRCICHIVTAGEQVVVTDSFREYLRERNVYLHNHYGPSESHVVTALTIDPGGDIPELPSIGKPVMNTGIYVVDKFGKLSPSGVVGEIRIGGVQVGRGYLNRPELTSERFVTAGHLPPTIHHAPPTFYKTGDLARFLPDGNIEFLGRIDHQVKIRGFRVEPGEIEGRLLNYPGIKEAVVSVQTEDGGDKYICAYVVFHRENGISGLRASLSKELPDYMIPSHFVPLEKIPLTPNGKIDRRALPKPGLKAGRDYVPPGNSTEARLVELWADVLNIRPGIISMDGNFFQLGGHSLKATILASRVHKTLNVKLPLAEIFKTPTIRDLSEYIRGTAEDVYQSIMPVEEKEYYVLSFAQKRMYILQQLDLNGTVYNMPEIIPLPEGIDLTRLEQSFRKLIKRHDSLRTSFHMIGDQPVQKVHREVDFKIEKYEESRVHDFLRAFDLSCAPLLRVGEVRTAGGENYLLVDMHHIISDGVSHRVLRENFTAFYDGKGLPPLRIQYKDFAQWQHGPEEVERLHRQRRYWLKEFEGEIPLFEIPLDYPRPMIRDFEGDSATFGISAEETRALNAAASAEGATLFMLLLALFNVLLSKLGGREDIIVGTPVAGRRHVDLENIIGMFVNTLALRNYPGGELTFREFLVEVKSRALDAFENQEYPFEELVDQVLVARDTGRNPLFDVMFVLQNFDEGRGEVNKEEVGAQSSAGRAVSGNIPQTSKFDMTLIAVDGGVERGLLFSVQYCKKLFKEETVETFSRCYKKIVSLIIEEPDRKLKEIEIISEEEKRRILYDFNDTESGYPKDKTIHQLFEEQVEKSYDHIAVVGPALSPLGNVHLTYNQLNKKSNQLARRLKEKGVGPGTIVAIMVERSLEMIPGILGILKSGGAYLPIDPKYPRERIDFMLKDTGVGILLTEDELMEKPCVEARYLDSLSSPNLFAPRLRPSHPAYILYTSGSTGKPKGVVVEHREVVDYIWWAAKTYIKGERNNFPFYTSISFDLTVTSVFIPLITGNSIIVYADDGTFFLLDRIIDDNRVEVIKLTPSHLKLIKDKEIKMGTMIKRFIVGGEELKTRLAKEIYRVFNGAVEIYNEYGPTETVVGSMIYKFEPGENDRKSVLIGVPADNTRIYILDKNLQVVPIGVPGEIYIAGDGVARGYLNRPDLTLEKFVENPFEIGNRMYRTGDLGRWSPDGNIEFLGRIDHQVKIRGFRIETAEIESVLLKNEYIKQVVVACKEDNNGDKYLCAYYVAENELNVSILKNDLSGELPDYMIPSHFVPITKIPLTPNGKIDKRALPEPELKGGERYVAPRDEVERKLVGLWSEILGRDVLHASQLQTSIGIGDNFFRLGGHSLKATVMISKIHKELNVSIPLVELFKEPTIEALARYILTAEKAPYIPANERLMRLKAGPVNSVNLFLIHDGTGELEGYLEFCKHITNELNIWGLRIQRHETLAPCRITIRELARSYITAMKTVQSKGPYYIAGWSLGGTIAFEIAAQLEQSNEEVACLTLFDSPPPEKNALENAEEFSLKSELKFINNYDIGGEITETFKNLSDIELDQFWSLVVKYLETNDFDVELLKQLIVEHGMLTLPNFDRLDIKDSIYYLNVGRTLRSARARYIPTGELKTKVHYFKASQSMEIAQDQWKKYCRKSITYYTIDGDHYSIFTIPGVLELSAVFSQILKEGAGKFCLRRLSEGKGEAPPGPPI